MPAVSKVIVLAVSGAIAVAGCASSQPGWQSGGPALPNLASKSQGPQGAKPYGELAKDYQQRTIVSPGMGLNASPSPSIWQRAGASISAMPGRVGNSFKSASARMRGTSSPGGKMPAMEPAPPINGFSMAKKSEAGPDLYNATAQVCEKSGNYAGAIQQYEKALKVAPNHLATLLSYAHLLDRQGNLEQATQLYQRAVKAHPNDAAAYNDLGLCYARRIMLNEAAQAVSKAVTLQPSRALYRNNLAAIYVEQRRPDDALRQLKAIHTESIACYNLGYLLVQRGQEQVAAVYFNRAVQADPTFAEARGWSERLAARGIGPSPAGGPVQVAAMPSSTILPGTYAPAAPSGAAVVGNRYADAPPSTSMPLVPGLSRAPAQPQPYYGAPQQSSGNSQPMRPY